MCVCACGLCRFLCRGIIKTRWYIWVQQCGTLAMALYFGLLRFFNEFLHWTRLNATKDHCHVDIIDKYLNASFFQLAWSFILLTRGPWTAMPALIEVKETDKINWHFYVHQKVIQNWGNFMGIRSLCVNDFNWKARKLPTFRQFLRGCEGSYQTKCHLKTSTEVRRLILYSQLGSRLSSGS